MTQTGLDSVTNAKSHTQSHALVRRKLRSPESVVVSEEVVEVQDG